MAFWNVDLTTSDGADSAAQVGALSCFVSGGLGVLNVIAVYPKLVEAGVAVDSVVSISMALVAVEAAVYVIAGFRLRAGKGLGWALGAALWLGVDLATKLFLLTQVMTVLTWPLLIVNTLLLIGVITGVRGANALRRHGPNVGDIDGVFD